MRIFRPWPAAALALAVLFLFAGPGHSQDADVRALISRMERLERQMATVEQQVFRGLPPPAATAARPLAAPESDTRVADLTVRMTNHENDLRSLNGELETSSNAIRRLETRLDKLTQDIDFRLRALETRKETGEAGTAPAAAQTASLPAKPAEAEKLPPGVQSLGTIPAKPGGAAPAPAAAAKPVATINPEAQYELARKQLLSQDYPGAEKSLTQFLAAYSTHALAPAAQYWLGETYYVRKDYPSAAATFAEGYENYRKSDKAPDLLLKLGLSLSQMGRKDQACASFAELARAFPDMKTNIQQRATAERTKLGCRK